MASLNLDPESNSRDAGHRPPALQRVCYSFQNIDYAKADRSVGSVKTIFVSTAIETLLWMMMKAGGRGKIEKGILMLHCTLYFPRWNSSAQDK